VGREVSHQQELRLELRVMTASFLRALLCAGALLSENSERSAILRQSVLAVRGSRNGQRSNFLSDFMGGQKSSTVTMSRQIKQQHALQHWCCPNSCDTHPT